MLLSGCTPEVLQRGLYGCVWQHMKQSSSSWCIELFLSPGMLQEGRSMSNSVKTNKSRPSLPGLMLDAKVENEA